MTLWQRISGWLAVAGAFLLAVLGAIVWGRVRQQQRRAADVATDLADENAKRARAQADAAREAAEAQAQTSVQQADQRAAQEVQGDLSTGTLGDYLRRHTSMARPKPRKPS